MQIMHRPSRSNKLTPERSSLHAIIGRTSREDPLLAKEAARAARAELCAALRAGADPDERN